MRARVCVCVCVCHRYEGNPWLCNLDWESKKFRGRAKKADMSRLVQRIEEYYNHKEEEFRSGGRERDREEREEEEEERKFEFMISGENPGKRSVHMPGYPE